VLLVCATAAGLVALGRLLVPEIPLPLSARMRAAIEVVVWAVPYGAVLGYGVWKFVFDEHERGRVRSLVAKRLGRTNTKA
jgi:hypothetical protein